jgi:hypothetical protein
MLQHAHDDMEWAAAMLSLEAMEAFISEEPDFRRDDVCNTLFLAIQVSDQYEEHNTGSLQMATAHQLADATEDLIGARWPDVHWAVRCQQVKDALVRFRYGSWTARTCSRGCFEHIERRLCLAGWCLVPAHDSASNPPARGS